MALKIRLQTKGARHSRVYRIVVAEATSPRDGKFIETLGIYNPQSKGVGQDQEQSINIERIDYWLSVGAQPTDTAKSLIKNQRILNNGGTINKRVRKKEKPVTEVAEAVEAVATPEAPTEEK